MNPLELETLWLSARLALMTTALCWPLALLLASWSGRRRGQGRWLIDAALLMPMSLSPAVVGWGVLQCLGPGQGAAPWLAEHTGLVMRLNPHGFVLVASCLTLPLMIRLMRPAFETVDTGRIMTARTLGANRWDAWWHVTASQARPALWAAGALGFAAAWGETGASVLLAASLQGDLVGDSPSGTVPLSIVNALQTPAGQTLAWHFSLVSLGVALAASLISEWSHQRWRRRALPQGARGVAA